jgi:hypothetical protein
MRCAFCLSLPKGQCKTRRLTCNFVGDRTDEILARWRQGEGTAWYLTDYIGTIRDLVDARLVRPGEFWTSRQIVVRQSP